MRFSLFYEHQLPRPWAEDSERRLLEDALEQIVIAERAGFDCVWEVEHHFLEEYSHSSAPEVFLAAASQRTERIRLGHGIIQLPPGVNHPARVAERVATLDLVSGGRVEFGSGEGSSAGELGGFLVDRTRKHEQWEDALDAITRMFVEEPFAGWESEFFRMPPRNVVPKPLQRPHPPLWVACSRRETIQLAARKGIGALAFSFVEPEDAGKWVDEYYDLIASEECVPAGFAVNPKVAVILPMMAHPDEAEAIERGIDGAHFFGYSLAHYYGGTPHAIAADRRLPGVPRAPRRDRLRARHRHPGPGAAGREASAGGPRLASRGDRHAGADRRAAAPLRGGRRRRGRDGAAGRTQHARAHLREPGAVRRAGDPAVRRGAREARGGEGRAAGAGDRGGARARASRRASAAPST